MGYFVYILYLEELDVYYKGFSTDVIKRLEYHLDSRGKFTSKAKDWKIVYIQEFSNKTEALLEEKRLKKLNRISLEKLIKGQNCNVDETARQNSIKKPVQCNIDRLYIVNYFSELTYLQIIPQYILQNSFVFVIFNFNSRVETGFHLKFCNSA